MYARSSCFRFLGVRGRQERTNDAPVVGYGETHLYVKLAGPNQQDPTGRNRSPLLRSTLVTICATKI